MQEELISSTIPAMLLVTEVEMGGVEQTSRLTGTDLHEQERKRPRKDIIHSMKLSNTETKRGCGNK